MNKTKSFDFIDNGLYYKINGTTVTVCDSVLNNYNGYNNMFHANSSCDINIPAYVTFKGVRYTVTMIGQSAFSGCQGIISVFIPNTVTKIGRSAFFGCSEMKSIIIPNTVTEIGEHAFYGCKALKRNSD